MKEFWNKNLASPGGYNLTGGTAIVAGSVLLITLLLRK